MSLLVGATWSATNKKYSSLETARVQIEILKRLIRIAHEISIFTTKQYLQLERDLQTISKMLNGWIKYLPNKPTN